MNWWLLALAFVLGLVLTASFMIRRGTREVATAEPAVAEPEVVEPAAEPDSRRAGGAPNRRARTRGCRRTVPVRQDRTPTVADRQGWTVKGNEESMLYHSPESPSFGMTRAEVWFRDVETAEAAGFNRWDSGKSQRGKKSRPLGRAWQPQQQAGAAQRALLQ